LKAIAADNKEERSMSNPNIALVQSMYAAFGRGDIATIIKNVTPQIEWQSGGRAEDFPTFGPRKGPQGVEQFFKEVAQHNEFAEFSPREFHADGDKVFVLGYYDIKLRANGKSFASDWVHIFTIRDGKVAKFREFLDSAAAAAAFRG
jgi:ketosteroid isomerase-like protein